MPEITVVNNSTTSTSITFASTSKIYFHINIIIDNSHVNTHTCTVRAYDNITTSADYFEFNFDVQITANNAPQINQSHPDFTVVSGRFTNTTTNFDLFTDPEDDTVTYT